MEMCGLKKAMGRGCAVLAAVAGWPARAGLPTVSEPSSGAVEEGDYLGALQAYALDAVVLGGLLLAAIALLVVGSNVLRKYSDVADGRATWGEVGMNFIVGVVLIVIIIFLATQSADILGD